MFGKKTVSKQEWTDELVQVVGYMRDVLYNEFPTDVITIDYIIVAILDKRDSFANMVLDNCLTSESMDNLRAAYVECISEKSKAQLKRGAVKFDAELESLFSSAAEESESDGIFSTFHVLMALMNPKNKFSERKLFEKFGLDYSFLCDSSVGGVGRKGKPKKKPAKKREVERGIPMKAFRSTESVNTGTYGGSIGRYTTVLSREGGLAAGHTFVGREREMDEIMSVLMKMDGNHVILVGDDGVGKTSIVRELSRRFASDSVPKVLSGKNILMLNPNALIGGTNYRGMFEDRVNSIVSELSKRTDIILFIDDLHTAFMGGDDKKYGDVFTLVSSLMEAAGVRLIAATTHKGYRSVVESNPSLECGFHKIPVSALGDVESERILEGYRALFEDFHGITYGEAVASKAVSLAGRYITSRPLPRSAVEVFDLIGAGRKLLSAEPDEVKGLRSELSKLENSRKTALDSGDFESVEPLTESIARIKETLSEYRRNSSKAGLYEVTEDDVIRKVSEIAKIPVSVVTVDEKRRVLGTEDALRKIVVGQDESISEICKVIRRGKAGLSDNGKTMGVFLLNGSTGVGKTLTAKAIASEVYGDEKALIRLDMSEYSEKHSVSRLCGTSPGYIGYDDGGVLTNAIKKRPYSVVLLDEIEKADDAVFNLFLQVFDEGRVTDGHGSFVDCRNCMFIMTSNVGVREANETGGGIGFTTDASVSRKSVIEKAVRKRFSPEFLNRVDKILYYNSLSGEDLRQVVRLELGKFAERVASIGYSVSYDEDVVEYIYSSVSSDTKFGARPVARIICDEIEDRVVGIVLRSESNGGKSISVSMSEGRLSVGEVVPE